MAKSLNMEDILFNRKRLLRILDWLYLRIATRKYGLFGPVIAYQNIPWAGIYGAKRAIGTEGRFKAMVKFLEGHEHRPTTILDIGCNAGYFSLAFAERGAVAYGVDMEPTSLRVATIASGYLDKEAGPFIPFKMQCTPQSIANLPGGDITICLSIWHHWVRYQGLECATKMLRGLWHKTTAVLFFDTGENEMPEHYNLPFFGENAADWVEKYLGDSLDSASITKLGRYKAFAPEGREENACVSRTLFAIERKV